MNKQNINFDLVADNTQAIKASELKRVNFIKF